MLKKGMLLFAVVGVMVLGRAHGASSGTAWGIQIGTPGCSGTGANHNCYLTLHVDGNPNGDLTIVKCTPTNGMDTWCSAVTSNETVIVSVTGTPVLCPSNSLVSTELVPDGITKSHYCYPGPCGQ